VDVPDAVIQVGTKLFIHINVVLAFQEINGMRKRKFLTKEE
jgi:hypothetical protein